ncbi:MAG: heavy-metal-associated domain-containing protein [Pseudolysinimonas sp.]
MCNTDTTSNDLGLTDKNHACTCGTDSHTETAAPVSENAIREHYLVEGMTCSHCVASVTEEVSAVDGVESVSVDLNAGGTSKIEVVSSKPVDAEAIRTAVTEAGYALVSA